MMFHQAANLISALSAIFFLISLTIGLPTASREQSFQHPGYQTEPQQSLSASLSKRVDDHNQRLEVLWRVAPVGYNFYTAMMLADTGGMASIILARLDQTDRKGSQYQRDLPGMDQELWKQCQNYWTRTTSGERNFDTARAAVKHLTGLQVWTAQELMDGTGKRITTEYVTWHQHHDYRTSGTKDGMAVPSDAEFRLAIDKKHKFIVVTEAKDPLSLITYFWAPHLGPPQGVRDPGPPEAWARQKALQTIPEEHRLSDFLAYECRKAQLNDLKYLIFQSVHHPQETLDIVLDVLGQGVAVPKWPGKTFEVGSWEYSALIACENFKGLPWFLSQRQTFFHHSAFSAITIFLGVDDREPGEVQDEDGHGKIENTLGFVFHVSPVSKELVAATKKRSSHWTDGSRVWFTLPEPKIKVEEGAEPSSDKRPLADSDRDLAYSKRPKLDTSRHPGGGSGQGEGNSGKPEVNEVSLKNPSTRMANLALRGKELCTGFAMEANVFEHQNPELGIAPPTHGRWRIDLPGLAEMATFPAWTRSSAKAQADLGGMAHMIATLESPITGFPASTHVGPQGSWDQIVWRQDKSIVLAHVRLPHNLPGNEMQAMHAQTEVLLNPREGIIILRKASKDLGEAIGAQYFLRPVDRNLLQQSLPAVTSFRQMLYIEWFRANGGQVQRQRLHYIILERTCLNDDDTGLLETVMTRARGTPTALARGYTFQAGDGYFEILIAGLADYVPYLLLGLKGTVGTKTVVGITIFSSPNGGSNVLWTLVDPTKEASDAAKRKRQEWWEEAKAAARAHVDSPQAAPGNPAVGSGRHKTEYIVHGEGGDEMILALNRQEHHH